jgi:hypothetical protein
MSLAVLAGPAALGVKRKASEAVDEGEAEAAVLKADLEGLVKKVAREGRGGTYYLEDEDYGARYAPLSTAARRAGGREATVAEVL